MYTLSFIKKSSPPQPSKNRKINVVSDAVVIEQGDYTEVNPAEYFNNTQYPFIYLDGDRSDYIFNASSATDHGYYILYDNSKTSNDRRFYTNLNMGIPVDIRYSTEINKWILTDTGKQDGGIMEAESLQGPWIEGKYAMSDVSYVTPTPIPLSSIEAMFENNNINSSFLCFINYNGEQKMYYFDFLKRNGANLADYNGLTVRQSYCVSSAAVNINSLTKETPLTFNINAYDEGAELLNNSTTITLLEE